MPMLAQVPGYVREQTVVENHVTVQGGSNWDLSRSALETPVSELPALMPKQMPVAAGATKYLPSDEMPMFVPNETLHFARNSVFLTREDVQLLDSLPRHGIAVVAGHADSHERRPDFLAKRRAEVVARHLERRGVEVEEVRSFGDELELSDSPFDANKNRRVEVWEK